MNENEEEFLSVANVYEMSYVSGTKIKEHFVLVFSLGAVSDLKTVSNLHPFQ